MRARACHVPPVTGDWRWMLGLGAVPGLLLAVGMVFQPYSPRWLVRRGREDDAREVLHKVREDDEEIEAELTEIKDAAGQEGGVRDLVAPRVRPMVAIGLGNVGDVTSHSRRV